VGGAIELRKARRSGSEEEEGNTAATLIASGLSVLRSLENPRTLSREISSAPWSDDQGRSLHMEVANTSLCNTPTSLTAKPIGNTPGNSLKAESHLPFRFSFGHHRA
jgi:hypothetical protein